MQNHEYGADWMELVSPAHTFSADSQEIANSGLFATSGFHVKRENGQRKGDQADQF